MHHSRQVLKETASRVLVQLEVIHLRGAGDGVEGVG